ncbi:hypothetical protein CASFOL_021422 [Castilleja foliolosa]|uniref:F-box domain-containing protein n=1 Tax=Castilleja foliolosa TaxID=1961234 RepID=A0ABD3CXD1_9LAMI
MKTQPVKRKRGDDDDDDDDDDGSAIAPIDRLSQLPQPILHNILSLLPQKDATRTSVLSKSWRYLWHGRFSLEFRDNLIRLHRKNEFWSFFDNTLQRYLDQNLSLQKFLFDIYHHEVDFELLQKWIPVVIMNMGVKSFNFIFQSTTECKDFPFPLPLVVFQSESLVELNLQGCDLSTLKSTDNVMLNNLHTLRLSCVNITDDIFDKIISSCPLIENLYILFCTGLKSIKLHKHHNIKDFGYSAVRKINIEIEDPSTLESFHFKNCRSDWIPPFKNMHFPHLKSLKLRRVQLSAETFDYFSSFFPCLNELILDSCHGLKEFRLLSSSIKRLTMKVDSTNPGKMMKAFIDTPNILYFEYSGVGVLPSITFTTTSNEWQSKISLWNKPDFLKLNKLLKALSQSHITLNLFDNVHKKLHINDSYGGFRKPVAVEHLKLWGCLSSSFDAAILNCFFRICHPRFIHIDLDLYNDVRAKRNLVEYISKLIPDETRYLEEASFEVWDMKAKEWHCVKETSFPALCCSQQKIRFQLTWKEQ